MSDPTTLAEVVDLYERWGNHRYDERVTQTEHARQTAALAHAEGQPPAVVAAALLHDVGHLLAMVDRASADVAEGDDLHEARGADALERIFGPEVAEPVRLHVAAKRVLVRIDAGYQDQLSPGSARSLELQGGPADDEEVDRYRALPFADAALTLRRYDDAGKVVGLAVAPFRDYVAMLEPLDNTPTPTG